MKMRTAKSIKPRTIAKKAGAPGHTFELPLDTAPMVARTAEALPDDGAWQFEPKWDGFRCLAFKAGAAVELRAKSGKPLGRYFPEVVALLRDLSFDRLSMANSSLKLTVGFHLIRSGCGCILLQAASGSFQSRRRPALFFSTCWRRRMESA
jgi:hypothetical protein